MRQSIEYKAVALIVFLIGALGAQAQKVTREGGFGGASFHSTVLMGQWTVEAGGFGARYFNQNWYVGGGGYGLDIKDHGIDYSLGYGGLLTGKEWILRNEKTSITLEFFGGLGGLIEQEAGEKEATDAVGIIKPKVDIEFHIAPWMRVGIGGGYRWIFGSDLSTVTDRDLSSNYASLTLRFGSF